MVTIFFSAPCCPQALLCSCFVPGYCGMMPPCFKGVVSIFYQRRFWQILFSAVSLTFDNVRWSSLAALRGRGFQQHAAFAACSLQPNPDSVSVLRGDGYLSRRHSLHVGHGCQRMHTEGQRGQQHPDPQRSLPHDFRSKAQPFTTY